MNQSQSCTIAGFEVELSYKRVRNINLRIHRDGHIVISAPLGTSFVRIENFVREKQDWIRKAQAKIEKRNLYTQHSFSTGDTLTLWGEAYRLMVVPLEGWKHAQLNLEGDALHLVCSPELASTNLTAQTARQELYTKFLTQELKAVLPEISAYAEFVVGEKAASWQVRSMQSRWGSCTPATRKIRLSSELAAFPRECAEYVAIHECVHLLEPSHNERFHAFMDRFCPSWKEARARLNQGAELDY